MIIHRATGLGLALLLLGGVAPVAAQSGPRELRTITAGGANVYMRLPAGWRAGGPLVVVSHGYSLDFDEMPDLGPLVELQLAQGYAVAASGFRTRGWAPYVALDDNALLVERFTAEFGAPGQILAVGGSMGGLISLRMGEDRRFAGRVAGVYALCPVVDGGRAWDSGFNLRIVYDAVCAGVGGGELLQGDAPLNWAMNLAEVPESISFDSRSDPAVRTAARITQCTGVTLPAFLRTSAQRDRLATIKALSGINDEEFLLLNLGYATFGLSELVRAPDKAAGSSPFDNRLVRHADALPPAQAATSSIDERVRRVAPDRFARLRLLEASNANGLGSAPIVSLHTSGDELVPAWHQRLLRTRYRGQPVAYGAPGFESPNLLSAIVLESEGSHCSFNQPELEAGWNALRQWIADGRKPSVAELAQRCRDSGGAAACRIDAQASASSMLAQVPRTLLPYAPASANSRSGIWFDPARGGEGLVIEEIDESLSARENAFPQRAVVSWYTYAPGAAGGGAQRWITGLGVAHGDALVIDDAVLVSGGRLGQAVPVTRTRFGRIEIVFEEAAGNADPQAVTARLRYAATAAGYGSGELALRRLVFSRAGASTSAIEAGTAAGDPLRTARSGIYSSPLIDGQGLVLQQQQAGATVTSFLGVYAFDADGAPLWLSGANGISGGGRIVFDGVLATRGARFDAFDPAAVQRIPWGRVELEYAGCEITALAWQANDPRLGSGRIAVQRTVRTAYVGNLGGCTD
jgi:hypothetical protein